MVRALGFGEAGVLGCRRLGAEFAGAGSGGGLRVEGGVALAEVGGEGEEVGDGDELVVVYISGWPRRIFTAEIGGELEEVGDGDGVVEIQVADEGGADGDGGVGGEGDELEAGIGGDGGGGNLAAGDGRFDFGEGGGFGLGGNRDEQGEGANLKIDVWRGRPSEGHSGAGGADEAKEAAEGDGGRKQAARLQGLEELL